MQRFQFALEAILRIRQRQEEYLQQAYQEQKMRVEQQKGVLQELYARQHQTECSARLAGKDQVDINLERVCGDYLLSLKARIEEANLQLGRLKVELEQRRKAFIEGKKAVKVLEKLKEHRYQEYLKALRRQEQYFLDEMGSTRFGGVTQNGLPG